MTPHVVYNGATGGLGNHLRSALLERGLPVSALGSRLGDTAGLNAELERLHIDPGSSLVLIESAGMVSVGECEKNPTRAYDVNVTRTTDTARDFAEWSVDRNLIAGIVFVSSGQVYAPPEPGERLAESSPTQPGSVYAQTKLEAESRMLDIADVYGVSLAIGRVFGLIGPDQRPHYRLPGLILRIRDNNLSDVPGLDHVRDYLDTRDASRHLASLAVTAGGGGSVTVNICGGEPIRIGDLLDHLLEIYYQRDSAALEVARDTVGAAPGRPTDVPWLVGDPSLLAELANQPVRSIPIARTLADALTAAAEQHNRQPDLLAFQEPTAPLSNTTSDRFACHVIAPPRRHRHGGRSTRLIRTTRTLAQTCRVPRLLRIDHVLVDGVRVTSAEALRLDGSDHLTVVADLVDDL